MVRSTPLATHPSASQIHNVRYPGYGAVFTSPLACIPSSSTDVDPLRLGYEGLPQILPFHLGVDLAVEDHNPFGSPDPPFYPVQVARAPHLDSLRAHGPRYRGEFCLPEAGEIGRQAEGAEVVDLGAVARVVHDDDEQGYAEVDGAVEDREVPGREPREVTAVHGHRALLG